MKKLILILIEGTIAPLSLRGGEADVAIQIQKPETRKTAPLFSGFRVLTSDFGIWIATPLKTWLAMTMYNYFSLIK